MYVLQRDTLPPPLMMIDDERSGVCLWEMLLDCNVDSYNVLKEMGLKRIDFLIRKCKNS